MAYLTKYPTIAIVGAGLSGMVTTFELIQQAQHRLEIVLFDPSAYAGYGIAYATDCPLHLLNVPVERMGALHHHPEHFLLWLQKDPQTWRSLHPSFGALEIRKGTYVPRMIYGNYLQSLYAEAKAIASQKQISIRWNKAALCDAEPHAEGFKLTTEQGEELIAQALVIGVGVPWTNRLAGDEGVEGYLKAPWPLLTRMNLAKPLLQKCATVGLIGSGLTMLDVLATLKHSDFDGQILIFSRKGRLPQPHSRASNPSHGFFNPNEFPRSAAALFRKVRRDCEASSDWRQTIDGLRPMTSTLWQQLPPLEQKRFLRHLLSLWNCHRHRVAPEALALVDFFESRNRLKFLKARAIALTARNGQVDIQTSQGNHSVDLLVNCTGPDFRIAEHPCLLIQNILNRRLTRPDMLGYGLNVETRQEVSKGLFAVGTLLFGTYFETIAVPEIRRQCHTIASDILNGGQR